MDPAWYFMYQNDVRGPVDVVGLCELYRDGIVRDDTHVWSQGRSEWVQFASVEELVAAAEQQPAKKRRRGPASSDEYDDGSGSDISGTPPRQELPPGFVGWLEELEEEAVSQLFYVAVTRFGADAIRGLPHARDALLAAYVQRYPGCDDPNPANYDFTDDFFDNAVEDLTPEGAWELLGKGNLDAVLAVLRSAAELDEGFLSRVHALHGTGLARRLVSSKDLEGLVALLESTPGLVTTRDMHGRTVLHALAASGDAQLVQGVLERVPALASQVDGVDEKLDVPLHLAAREGAEGVVGVLLKAGANPNVQNRDTSEYASGNWSIKSADVEFKMPVPSQHQTPLHIAAEAGDTAIMRLLLDAGAKLDVRDSAGCTALHLALDAQEEEAAGMLLAAGANPALGNSDMGEDGTPLHQCCGRGQARLVEALLDTGKLDINAPGPQGWRPIHLAVRRGSLACVKLLVERGADVNARVGAAGKTALELALVNKREQIVELLRGAGAVPPGEGSAT